MGFDEPNRKLAAILAADMVGFSWRIGQDEATTLARLSQARRDVIEPAIASRNGRIFKRTGDGMLAEFPSAVLALRCAIDIQDGLNRLNAERVEAESVRLRIGVHQGEVVIEDDDLLGDGVNIAARLEPLAEPGGICVSGRVQEDVAGKITIDMIDLGEHLLKNIPRPVRILRVRLPSPDSAAMPSLDGTLIRAAPLPCHVLCHLNDSTAHDIAITTGGFLIGRTAPCHLILPDREISRRHCRIDLRNGAAYLSDLNSSNGTFVNGRRIDTMIELNHDARITLGAETLIYQRRIPCTETPEPTQAEHPA
ncbi:FHA domain-containing protein [Acidiphilium sp.]|uniref:FHA domain-containing protein n=1 Tax=Acidiphilium sp. TaxID=527 RepID=UPI003CFD4352